MKNIKKYLKNLPGEILRLIGLIATIAQEKKINVYLVGGFVRDLILKAKNLDLDIVVEGDGIRFAECLAKKLNAHFIRHPRFGTATVTGKTGIKIDIASARKERYPLPASLPVVSKGSLKDDLVRRDFTINAMAVSINRHNFGELIDFYRGFEDLKNKEINILHELSFVDDPTRILRAIRFEQRYGFKLGTKSLKCLKEAAGSGMLDEVSPHRVGAEFILMLKEKEPLEPVERLQKLCSLKFIHPRLIFSAATCDLFDSIGDEIAWFKKSCPGAIQLDEWLIYLMGLLNSLDAGEIKAVSRNLSLRREEEKKVLDYKKLRLRSLFSLNRKIVRPSKIFDSLSFLSPEAVILLKSEAKNVNFRRHLEDFLLRYRGERLFISGEDLKRLGVIPGPDFQRIFKRVLRARLEGKVKTKEQELALARRLV